MSIRLSTFFTLEEMTKSDTATRRGIENSPPPEAIGNLKILCTTILDQVRNHFNRPVVITSGYRSPALEKEISGVTTKDRSQHMTGQAADFVIPGVPCKDVFIWIMNSGLPFDQLIFEKSNRSEWIHVSYGPRRMCLLGVDTNNDAVMEYIHVNPETYA